MDIEVGVEEGSLSAYEIVVNRWKGDLEVVLQLTCSEAHVTVQFPQ